MSLICSISVVYLLGSLRFTGSADLECKKIGEGPNNYIVDCSKAAEENDYEGNYKKVLVKKENCGQLEALTQYRESVKK